MVIRGPLLNITISVRKQVIRIITRRTSYEKTRVVRRCIWSFAFLCKMHLAIISSHSVNHRITHPNISNIFYIIIGQRSPLHIPVIGSRFHNASTIIPYLILNLKRNSSIPIVASTTEPLCTEVMSHLFVVLQNSILENPPPILLIDASK